MATNYVPKLIFWLILIVAVGGGMSRSYWASSSNEAGLVINEFVADNDTLLVDEDGDTSDWIEIYNPTPETINLAGWSLTDDPTQPQKWNFPDISLASQHYLVVYASNKNRTAPERPLHTNFKLDRNGEFLGLYNVFAGKFVDQLDPHFPPQFRDLAFGRLAADDMHRGFLAIATPGRANDRGQVWPGVVERVVFDQPQGVHHEPFWLELKTPALEATIRYTTDGSKPNEIQGLTYDQPLWVDKTTVFRAAAFQSGFLPAPVETRTYIFAEDVLAQPKLPPGFPTTWGVHDASSAKFGGFVEGSPVIPDYEMDPKIVDQPHYRARLTETLTALPIVSLVIDIKHFTELYANPTRRGVEWERPASISFIYPQPEADDIQIEAGLRIQGHAGARHDIPKHSFRLLFKRQYGPGKLEHPLFLASPVDRFDTLVLRGGADRSFVGNPTAGRDPKLTVYARDEWMRASQIEMSGVGSHGTYVHLYLNGLYWGLYNLVERPDAAFLASYFGGDKADWYARNHGGVINGSEARIKALERDLAEQGGLKNYPKSELYALFAEYLDIPHFIDYVILNWYGGTKDWPTNNWYAGVQNPSGRIYFFVWDAEHTWVEGAKIVLGRPKDKNLVRFFLDVLVESDDFRIQFADRLYKHLFNDGALTEANARARWLRLTEMIEPAIVAESARWGDVRTETPITYDDWLIARDDVLAQMEGNVAKLITLTREAGYYPPIDPPTFSQQGGLIRPGFKLTMTGEQSGMIYYTVDGTDPRQWGTGQPAPTALIYDGAPLGLAGTTPVKARLLSNGLWSALNQATFSLAEGDHRLRITEIMYNPAGSDDYEFVELKNMSRSALEIANLSFEGLEFTFPANTNPLEPGEVIVLVRNQAAFSARYPTVAVAGVYQGRLSNSGEKLAIYDAQGRLVASAQYDTENGWPISPDGRGDSLILVDEHGDPNASKNWQASLQPHGSPGIVSN